MPLRPASDYDKLTPEDNQMVEELLTEMDAHFAKGAGTYYVNRMATDAVRQIPERVWKEVVRRANDLGYEGDLRGSVIELRRP